MSSNNNNNDIKVIRYVDGYERIMVPCWMILRGEHTLPKGVNAYEKLTKGLPAQLSKYQCTRLSIRNASTKPQYIEAYKPAKVISVEWAEAAPAGSIESYRMPAMSEDEWEEGAPLVVVCVAQRENNVQLTVKASHTIADGRTVEGIYRIVASVIDDSVLAPPDAPLPDFGQRSQFTMNDDEAYEIPEIWREVPRKTPIYPPLPDDVERVFMNSYVKYEWAPIRAFCKAHGVGLQGVLMAAACRANRKYNRAEPSIPIYVLVPGDTRRSPVATAEHARREVFSGSSVAIVRDDGHVDAMKEIVECNNGMRATQKTDEAAVKVTFFGALVDKETGVATPTAAYPVGDCPTVLVSNVGVYRFVKNPRLGCAMVCRGNGLSIYSYNNGKELEVFLIYPKGLDFTLIDDTVAEMDEVLCKMAGSKRC